MGAIRQAPAAAHFRAGADSAVLDGRLRVPDSAADVLLRTEPWHRVCALYERDGLSAGIGHVSPAATGVPICAVRLQELEHAETGAA